jgi:hypothetical protein
LSTPEKPTTAGILAAQNTTALVNAIDPQALWLWGRLKDFERDGLLARDPAEICDTMVPHMRETIQRLIPLVVAWLGRIPEPAD